MLDPLAQLSENLPPITDISFAAMVGTAFLFGLWWLVWVYKPQYEKRVSAEITAQDRRDARDAEAAAKQNKLYDVMSETIPMIHQTLTEFHKANETNHAIMQAKLDRLLADRDA